MKVKSNTTYSASVDLDGKSIDLPLSQKPSTVMLTYPDRLFASKDGKQLVFGYLIDDPDCDSPLDSEGEGIIYTARRGAGAEEHANFRKWRGLNDNWERDPSVAIDPFVVTLDIYEHGGIAYSIQNEGVQDRFDTARGGAIWVPDQAARENIQSIADRDGAPLQKVIRDYVRGVLESYNSWLNGDCYGFVVEKYTQTDDGKYEPDGEPSVIYGIIGSKYAFEELDADIDAIAQSDQLDKVKPAPVRKSAGRKP